MKTVPSDLSRSVRRRRRRLAPVVVAVACAALALSSTARPALAQGCILIRNYAPVFGATEDLNPQPGQLQVTFNYRSLKANDHYNGTQFQYERQSANTYVNNTQQQFDLSAAYTLSPRWSVTASVPVISSTWSVPTPFSSGSNPRREQNASGIGDVSATGRVWLLDPAKHQRGNLAMALGVKAPTGDYAVEDDYPDLMTGANYTSKAVDQSIQPGDGGWGILFDLQGYKRLKHVAFYGSGSYLINPRDTNGTDSIIVGLGFAGNPALADLLENSVPDQYVLRTGASFPMLDGKVAASIGFRMEGVPRYDLIGDSHGWRRPGYETFVEPGFSWSHGSSTWSFQIPLGLVRNRRPNPYTGNPGDATFPDYIVLVGYSYKFNPQGAAPAALARSAAPSGS